ncbi:hypothetical protein SAMN04489860_0992 [Paraoerskovia marina]|uniref:DUF4333 domain-containing protein n=1 Tax=Paraoerskovia marina TaxID=545619 RepID=A0A1H1Q5D7_9CELL|nr:hypothetical protein SAMN04489860_0992 [Paraoerskovia marina]
MFEPVAPGGGSGSRGEKIPASPEREADRIPLNNIAAWLLACSPIAYILTDVLLLQSGVSVADGWSYFVLGATGFVLLALWDVRYVQAAGYEFPRSTAILAVFGVPFYLVRRVAVTGGTWWQPVTWGILFLAYWGSANVVGFLGGVELDSDWLETVIDENYSNSGVSSTTECPNPAIAPVGGSVTCQSTFDDESWTDVLVTIEAVDGTVSWQEIG